jgi:hypothetical protein
MVQTIGGRAVLPRIEKTEKLAKDLGLSCP